MRYKGSKIAQSIDNEYKKKLEWKERVDRIKQNKTEILNKHLDELTIIKNKEN